MRPPLIMTGLILTTLVLIALTSSPSAAQDGTLPAMSSLPPELAERIAARPDRWRDVALTMIHGHGTGGALTQADIDRAAALDRAFFRARALQPMMQADLDNDGAVTLEEVSARAGRLAAGPRAELMMGHAAADADGDGTASAAELRLMAEAEAAGAAQGADAQMTAALMAFDTDGDGRLTLAEVASIHAALVAANG